MNVFARPVDWVGSPSSSNIALDYLMLDPAWEYFVISQQKTSRLACLSLPTSGGGSPAEWEARATFPYGRDFRTWCGAWTKVEGEVPCGPSATRLDAFRTFRAGWDEYRSQHPGDIMVMRALPEWGEWGEEIFIWFRFLIGQTATKTD